MDKTIRADEHTKKIIDRHGKKLGKKPKAMVALMAYEYDIKHK